MFAMGQYPTLLHGRWLHGWIGHVLSGAAGEHGEAEQAGAEIDSLRHGGSPDAQMETGAPILF